MEFRLLVSNRRHELGMETRVLEKKSGINHGTISRIENGHGHTLVGTAIHLCNALKMDPTEIIDPAHKKNLNILNPSQKSKDYLNTSDLHSLLSIFSKKPLSTLDKLMDLVAEFSTPETKPNFHLDEYWRKRSPGKDGDRITDLFDTFQLIQYPKKLENTVIMEILTSGGAISLLDFGHYVRNVRKGLSLSLLEVQELSGLSDSSLCNLENAFSQRIKLSDILILEKVLKAKGEFFQLIWNVCEYKARAIDDGFISGWSPQERILVNCIIRIYRWLQLQDNSMDAKWLLELRSQIF
jgi:transcriptional regulator with XRE-family HTH domain